MMTKILPCIEIEPTSSAKRSLIWLHGLGADGNDFVPIASELNLPSDAAMRFIFPHAPVMPVTINNGFQMRAWFDIYGVTINARIDSDGIMQSVASIDKLIKQEIARGIPTQHIFLGGFSQGAVIALITALCYSQSLAGIIALSGYLPLANEVLEKASPKNHHIPIFLGHGTHDPIVPFALGEATYSIIKQAAYPVTWHSYGMPHSVCREEIDDLSLWLKAIIDKSSPK